MKDMSVEVGNLMGCESEKLVIRFESAKDVLPCMASAIGLTNSREEQKEVNGRATTSRDIR
jgi:hypothetical protein